MNNIITLEGLLYEKNKAAEKEEGKSLYTYDEILKRIISLITTNHSKELASVLYSENAKGKLISLITGYLVREKLTSEDEDVEMLSGRIYEDMAGVGFVRKYLDDADVEEININACKGTWVTDSKGKHLTDEAFASPQDAINCIKKIARMGNLILDESNPVGDSYLAKGVRVEAMITPVVDENDGAVCSIRKQKPATVTEEKMIEWGTCTKKEVDFLKICVNNGISLAFAGGTGAGKTADMSIVLQGVDNRKRIYTIEDTRELLLEKLDENGYRINDLVQVYTKDDADENKRVTMDMLLRAALRMHPAIIVPAEMRGKEAVDAVEAGRTGHTIVSTLHANSAREAYPRIMTMYQKGDNTLSENTILSMIVEAFPILVYKEMMDDGSRKYTEIFEAEGVKDGKVVGRTLFKFEETGKDYDESGKLIKIRGEHKQVSSISKRLYSILKKRDIKDEVLKEYYYDN